MFIRQLKPKQHEDLFNYLQKNADTKPLEISYNVNMDINGEQYSIKIQPEPHFKMAVLQACRVKKEGSDFQLITQSSILSSLLELLIYQGVE